ncbi:MAG TPA: hypothetical protein EYH20_01565 [Leucothrix sp.]|nr:hypothetical protein [Leucothrix sp.]
MPLLRQANSFVLLICFFLCNACYSANATLPVVPVSWETIGPGGGGWLSAITVVDDPENTVYVACDVGGIYKSNDHGKSWKIKNIGLSIYYVHDIAYDPFKPTTLYAATRGGVYKSLNGGDSWLIKRTGFPQESEYNFSAPISDIVVDPDHPNVVYAGVGVPRSGYDELDSHHWQAADIKGAIYKSSDYGEHWKLIHNTGIDSDAMIYSLAIDPNDNNILYAATSKGVYKSETAGTTWTSKNTGLPHSLAMTLAINPDNSNTLFVTMWATPGSPSWQGGVYKSVNGGDDWVAKNNGLQKEMDEEEGLTSNYPQLVIDKNNPEILYLGSTPWTPTPGVYKTMNGGDSWEWISKAEPDEKDKNVDVGWITEHGVSVKSLAIDPNDSDRLYFGSSTHLITTEDAGTTWNQTYTEAKGSGYWKGNGLETTVVAAIAVDPTNSNNLYAGYWDMGFLKSNDGGVSFKRTFKGMKYDSNTFAIIVDPDKPSVIYTASGWWEENKGAVYQSNDYGDSWKQLGTGLPDAQIWSIALDKSSPLNARTLYAASYGNGIYKTIDGGEHWTQINQGLGVSGNLQVRKIVVDPNDPNVLYAGIEAKQIEEGGLNSTIQGGLFKSTDAGKHWHRIDSPSQITVWDIVIDSDNPQTIYTAVKSGYDHSKEETYIGGVYKSINGGDTWKRENTGLGNQNNLNVASIAISPTNSKILYAVTTDEPFHDRSSGRGIFKSINAGKNWVSVSSKSNVLYFETITIDPTNPSVLYAGSSGNGILKGVVGNQPPTALPISLTAMLVLIVLLFSLSKYITKISRLAD